MNHDLSKATDDLLMAIKTSKEYLALSSAEAKIQADKQLLTMISDIKLLQQQNLINPNLESEQLLSIKTKQLENNPVYLNYLVALNNFNEITIKINQQINQYLNNFIELK